MNDPSMRVARHLDPRLSEVDPEDQRRALESLRSTAATGFVAEDVDVIVLEVPDNLDVSDSYVDALQSWFDKSSLKGVEVLVLPPGIKMKALKRKATED